MSSLVAKAKVGISPHQSRGQETELQGDENCGHSNMNHESEVLQSSNIDKDVLPQWGQRKRLRNGRLDTKTTAVEESFEHAKKSVKTGRHAAIGEQAGSIQTQLPLVHRRHAIRACTPFREIIYGNEQRNVETCPAVRPVDNGSNNLRQQNMVTLSEKVFSPLQDEHETATCNGSGNGGSYSTHPQERMGLEAIQGRHLALATVDLDSFEWPKFLLALSRKEKEEDFISIKGSKLPQRPKKRCKHIEKALHYVIPGMWLSDLTRERYEVREMKATKKRPRGLKAMGSVDSDSD